MTHGKLLALDTPHNIKKQFGVGYKLIIEPRLDVISIEYFDDMKENIILPIILTKEN